MKTNLFLSFPSHHLQSEAEKMNTNQRHQAEKRWKEKHRVIATRNSEQIQNKLIGDKPDQSQGMKSQMGRKPIPQKQQQMDQTSDSTEPWN